MFRKSYSVSDKKLTFADNISEPVMLSAKCLMFSVTRTVPLVRHVSTSRHLMASYQAQLRFERHPSVHKLFPNRVGGIKADNATIQASASLVTILYLVISAHPTLVSNGSLSNPSCVGTD